MLATAVLVPVVRACNHRNDLSDLFPPAFVNSHMVQIDSLAILEPVVPVQSLQIPASALPFLALLFSLNIEDKGKARTSSSLDIAFDVVIKYLLTRSLPRAILTFHHPGGQYFWQCYFIF